MVLLLLPVFRYGKEICHGPNLYKKDTGTSTEFNYRKFSFARPKFNFHHVLQTLDSFRILVYVKKSTAIQF